MQVFQEYWLTRKAGVSGQVHSPPIQEFEEQHEFLGAQISKMHSKLLLLAIGKSGFESGLCPWARDFIMLASSVDRDVTGASVGRNWHRQWSQTIFIVLLQWCMYCSQSFFVMYRRLEISWNLPEDESLFVVENSPIQNDSLPPVLGGLCYRLCNRQWFCSCNQSSFISGIWRGQVAAWKFKTSPRKLRTMYLSDEMLMPIL